MQNNYYKKVFQNLNTNNIFYKYFNETYTYKESLLFAIKMLIYFKRNKLKKNFTICTFANKSFEMYSSIFPILISQITWVPISLSYPDSKIKEIIKQVNPNLIIYDHIFKKRVSFLNSIKKISFNEISQIQLTIDRSDLIEKKIKELNFKSIAFIYFTSGSTGESKGIKISHKNIIADIFAQLRHLHMEKNRLVFGDYYDTSFSIFFDIYYPAIYLGAAISPSKLDFESYLPIEHIAKNQVNVLICVPSTIQRIKDFYKNKKFNFFLKTIIVTGEPFYLSLLKYFYSCLKFKNIFNCYGGTEMSNWVFFHKCKRSDLLQYKKYNVVPIGKNFYNTKVKIINTELVVKGPTISQGYINKKLNSKFLFGKNNTFYTSDKVIKKHKTYICVGRLDKMVKLRGYRIDLSDIERNLRKLKYINNAIVFEKKKKNYENYIFTVLELNKVIKENKIRKDLGKYLPVYMIPKKIFILKKFPTNVNGKIDRKKIQNFY